MPKVALLISAVRMAKSRCSLTPRFLHSSVSSSRTAMPRTALFDPLVGVAFLPGADFAVDSGHFYQGTVCPPVGAEFGIPLAKLLDVVFDIDGAGEDLDHVVYGEIPLFLGLIPRAADLLFFKQDDGAHGACEVEVKVGKEVSGLESWNFGFGRIVTLRLFPVLAARIVRA